MNAKATNVHEIELQVIWPNVKSERVIVFYISELVFLNVNSLRAIIKALRQIIRLKHIARA